MSRIVSIFTALLLVLVSGALILTASCKKTTAPAFVTHPLGPTTTTASIPIVPYIPPAYYQCIEAAPMGLENAFYSNYGNSSAAEQAYDGQIFVFKDLVVDTWMISDVDQGWLWADLSKCPIVNINDAKTLQLGDYVDIVGALIGRDPSNNGGLLFQNCYVLTSGSIQLPAPGGGSTFVPGY